MMKNLYAYKAYISIGIVILSLIITYCLSFSLKFPDMPKDMGEISQSDLASKKYNVGLILPLGFTGDTEAAMRIAIAAKKLGWNCYVFQYPINWGNSKFLSTVVQGIHKVINYFFRTDFIIALYPSVYHVTSPEIPRYLVISFNVEEQLKWNRTAIVAANILDKLSQETKVKYNIRLSQFTNSWRYFLDYDGFLVVDSKSDWLQNINLDEFSHRKDKINIKDRMLQFYPSSYEFKNHSLAFNHLLYFGAGDALRSSGKYQEIFRELEKRENLLVYGPKKNWSYLSKAYQGFLPHDGFAVLNKIQQAGILLVLHGQFHLQHQIPSGRIFEGAAAGAVIISDINPFIVNNFGSCVLYVDQTKSAKEMVEQINKHVLWIKEHQQDAINKAKCVHDVFIQNFVLEKQLVKIAQMHEKINPTS